MEPVSAKVTSKGQVTLPAKLRRRLGVKPGDRIDFIERETGKIEIVARRKTFADLRGILAYDGPPLTDDEIVRWVEEARAARGEAAINEDFEDEE
ncbi:MAG TPA: AbrB/MazE/SpoVT family DNA-binding domain-containing protein [Afifellaceae bacterium]|nr:AbrB/MazE/SpoVT family DNA-binding domain-containing protein [Afifellaceae bacterium]